MRGMKRLFAVTLFCVLGVITTPSGQAKPFQLIEATIPGMQAAMASGQLTSRELVRQYLVRLAMYEDRLNASLYVNAHALEEADALDRERAQG